MFVKAFNSLLIALFFLAASMCFADTRMIIHQQDFDVQNQWNSLSFFAFEIIFEGDLKPGIVTNPPLVYIEYHVIGQLQQTPSGINVFHLTRIMDGEEFYGQGSSFHFEIAANADLTNGLQANELVGGIVFDAVEMGTGQYHSPILNLNNDGTGSIENAANFGGINRETGMFVDVEIGEEYAANFTFDLASYALTEPMIGDLNFDCEINLLDVQPFVNALTNDEYDPAADTNGDGVDDLLDVAPFVQLLL